MTKKGRILDYLLRLLQQQQQQQEPSFRMEINTISSHEERMDMFSLILLFFSFLRYFSSTGQIGVEEEAIQKNFFCGWASIYWS
jgi:hypothetical protein